MIQLFIDNKEVVLSDSFSTDFILSNPFFTKDGGYTFDIDIDLNIPQNAAIFCFMNRFSSSFKPLNRTAVIRSAGRTLVQGTETILELDGSVVKIQIVTDNSQLNYLASQKSDIRRIPMEMSFSVGYQLRSVVMLQKYPEANYCYPAFLKSNCTTKKNYLQECNQWGHGDNTVFYPFPYLLYIIECVVADIGYAIRYNALLENPDNCRLFIISKYGLQPGVNTHLFRFQLFLPEWTANDFLTEVEKFFNVTFVVNRHEKTVDIVNVTSFYQNNANTFYIPAEDILDDFEKKYDAETVLWINYDNISYDLPDSVYYKYADIDENIYKKCTVERLANELPDDSTLGKYVIFRKMALADYDVVRRKIDEEENQIITALAECNQFCKVVSDEESKEEKLKIVPAYVVAYKAQWITQGLDNGFSAGFLSVPLIDDIDYDAFQVSDQEPVSEIVNLNTDIEDGEKKEDTERVMRLAYYNGLTPVHNGIPDSSSNMSRLEVLQPQSQTHNVLVYSQRNDKENEQVFVLDGESMDLSLKYRYNLLYRHNPRIDVNVEYTVRFLSHGHIYDERGIFVMANRKFYCKQLKYKMNVEGLSEVVEGVFYALDE